MEKFVIRGNKKLSGSVKIGGAKNAVLPIMAAAMLARGEFVLENIPQLQDIKFMSHLLETMGVKVEHVGSTMKLDTKNVFFQEAPYDIVRKMRASIYVLAPQLALMGKAVVSFPGGCAIGARPVDLHLKAMEALGAEIQINHGNISASVENLMGCQFYFEKISVGATANMLMACCLAQGETIIENAAKEPEIIDLCNFLIKMGADISGVGSSTLKVQGVSSLHACDYEVIPDRIEAGTFLLAGAITKSEIIVENCVPEHLKALLQKMEETGCKFTIDKRSITVYPPEKILSAKKVITSEYPGFPTDLQAQFMAYMGLSEGSCIIEDVVFPDRFMHVAELSRLGADIQIDKNIAIVEGVDSYSGAKVMATDLRASAALVLAGLASENTTEIMRIYHIRRGYEKIEEKLRKLGADIEAVQEVTS